MRHKLTVLRGFECYTENRPLVLMFFPSSQGLNVFIPLYNSLYIKYIVPIVVSCNIIVGKKMFGWAGPSVDF